MKALTKVLTIGVVVLFFAPAANADLQDGLNSMFMSTGSEPQIYQSQRRLGFDMGTLRLRAPISTFNLVNLTPPTVRAGCGGIDLYGGSFSFINEEQFRQMIRQIGANALGYAFKLALASMCDLCDGIISGLQDVSDKLTQMQVDSCRWGAGLVNDATSAMKLKVEEDAVQDGSAKALFTDGFQAVRSLFENPGNAVAQGSADGADPNNRGVGNLTWKALIAEDTGAKFNFVPGSVDNNELLMNIAGTFIIREANATETEEGMLVGAIDPRVTYTNFKLGKQQDSSGTEDLTPLYTCEAGTPSACLDMVPGAKWSFEGVDAWVNSQLTLAALLMVDPATASVDAPLATQNFLASMPLTVVRHMQYLQGDEDSLDVYVRHIRPYITATYTSSLALSMVQAIRAAFEPTDTPNMPDNVRANLAAFEMEAKDDLRVVQESFPEIWAQTEDLVGRLQGARNQASSAIQ